MHVKSNNMRMEVECKQKNNKFFYYIYFQFNFKCRNSNAAEIDREISKTLPGLNCNKIWNTEKIQKTRIK
jgi:hypothetical protein